MRPNYLTEYFPKYIAKHGMPKMRFHDLRHSCASLLLANGVPLKQIQEWLGHSDFSTTANIYAHLDYRSKISSAQAMEQGMLLPRSDDFGSRWENVTEQGKITEPDSNQEKKKKTRCSNAKTANSNAVLTRKSENSRSRTKKESPANP